MEIFMFINNPVGYGRAMEKRLIIGNPINFGSIVQKILQKRRFKTDLFRFNGQMEHHRLYLDQFDMICHWMNNKLLKFTVFLDLRKLWNNN